MERNDVKGLIKKQSVIPNIEGVDLPFINFTDDPTVGRIYNFVDPNAVIEYTYQGQYAFGLFPSMGIYRSSNLVVFNFQFVIQIKDTSSVNYASTKTTYGVVNRYRIDGKDGPFPGVLGTQYHWNANTNFKVFIGESTDYSKQSSAAIAGDLSLVTSVRIGARTDGKDHVDLGV